MRIWISSSSKFQTPFQTSLWAGLTAPAYLCNSPLALSICLLCCNHIGFLPIRYTMAFLPRDLYTCHSVLFPLPGTLPLFSILIGSFLLLRSLLSCHFLQVTIFSKVQHVIGPWSFWVPSVSAKWLPISLTFLTKLIWKTYLWVKMEMSWKEWYVAGYLYSEGTFLKVIFNISENTKMILFQNLVSERLVDICLLKSQSFSSVVVKCLFSIFHFFFPDSQTDAKNYG